jgi:DNA-binding Lrp family transcriptional regulator
MDETDKTILNRIQENFPVAARPFLQISQQLDCDEREVLARVQRLKEEGIIRRVGAVFDLRKLGFQSTLCAARVPDAKAAAFAAAVNALAGVTHNYRRDNEYNIWFTLIMPSAEEISETLEKIKKETGIDDILNLPATRTFKINARFDV